MPNLKNTENTQYIPDLYKKYFADGMCMSSKCGFLGCTYVHTRVYGHGARKRRQSRMQRVLRMHQAEHPFAGSCSHAQKLHDNVIPFNPAELLENRGTPPPVTAVTVQSEPANKLRVFLSFLSIIFPNFTSRQREKRINSSVYHVCKYYFC